MEANTFQRKLLSFLLFTLFLNVLIASPVKANNSSSISTNSTQNVKAHNFAHVPLKHSSTENFKNFVMTHCKSTISPALCYDYLSPHAYTIAADLKKLCNTSIIVALNTTRTASSTVINGQKSNNLTKRATGLLQLCANNVNAAIGKLQKSIDIMGHVNAANRLVEVAKIKALLDESATNTGYCYGEHTYDPKNVDEIVAWTVYEDVFYASAMNTFSLTFINELLHLA